MAVQNPHFAVPFRFDHNNVAATVEQGSVDDLYQQVAAILRTHKGQRLDLMDFGIDDVGFTEGVAQTARLQRDIERYAPEASFSIDTSADGLEQLMQKIRVTVYEGTEE